MSDTLDHWRDPDTGHFYQYADPGGYLIEWVDNFGNSLCAECAEEIWYEVDDALGWDCSPLPLILEAGDSYTCDECGREKT